MLGNTPNRTAGRVARGENFERNRIVRHELSVETSGDQVLLEPEDELGRVRGLTRLNRTLERERIVGVP